MFLLSCVVSEPIYGHLMGVIGTGFLSLESSLRTADVSTRSSPLRTRNAPQRRWVRRNVCRSQAIYSLQYTPLNGHKSTHGPHRRDVTHILCRVSCFYGNFDFVGYRNDRFFPHTNPYIMNVMQQCLCSPMLIFRAWATCGDSATFGTKLMSYWDQKYYLTFELLKCYHTSLGCFIFSDH